MYTSTVAGIRELEKKAVDSGVPEYELMRRAGVMAAAWIEAMFPDAGRFVVVAGGGNNGGDALVAAANLTSAPVKVFAVKPLSEYSGCAAKAAMDLPENIPVTVKKELCSSDLQPGDVIIDGLLGIGFSGERVRENIANSIEVINRSHLPVVALDLPSGINGYTGKAAENGAVKAYCTLTFGAVKTGLITAAGSAYRGCLRLLDIGLAHGQESGEAVFTNVDAVKVFPEIPVDCHKNSRGRVTVWGGSPEYPGAAALAAEAALKSGAGIVRCASEADLSGRLKNAVIFRKLSGGDYPEDFFANSDVLVCGCGWGSCAGKDKLQKALSFHGVTVLDADALNCMSQHPEVWQKRHDVIITPHPGEAERLRVTAGLAVAGSRRELAAELALYYGTVTVLKGRDTVVASPAGEVFTVVAGSQLLATAGSGDVLAGVIGALAGQPGISPLEAALLGVYAHGAAGEGKDHILIADELPEMVSCKLQKIRYNNFI